MASKVKVERFERRDKSTIHGKQGHSRTGACRAKGKCFCTTSAKQRRNIKRGK